MKLFERRTAVPLLWIAGLSLAVTLFFLVFGDRGGGDERSWRADSFSPSAIGYRALARFLDGWAAVLISRHSSAFKASPTSPLLVLEPPAADDDFDRLRAMVVTALQRQAAVVVVLPKWRGRPLGRSWVGGVEPLPPEVPARVLRSVLGSGDESGFELVRLAAEASPWSSALMDEEDSVRLSLAEPRQLLRDRSQLFEPLMASDDGILIARASGSELYLIADPDLLNTRGLAHGDNAVLAHRLLIDHLEPAALVIDETLHGYRQPTSVWRAMLEPPLLTLSLHLAALTALVVWAGGARFGRSLAPPPRVPPGKRTLVDNTARLFGLREHLRHSLEEYFRLTVHRVAARLRPSGGFRQQVTALSHLGRSRGLALDVEELGRRAHRFPSAGGDPRRALALARDLYRWRKEITDDPRRRPSAR